MTRVVEGRVVLRGCDRLTCPARRSGLDQYELIKPRLDHRAASVSRFQHLFRTSDVFEDFVGLGSPDEWFWVAVMLFEIAFDGGLKISDAMEDAASDANLGDLAEESFNLIEP